jgi:peptidoglycan/LPS O-acetylase OafA/YrhL
LEKDNTSLLTIAPCVNPHSRTSKHGRIDATFADCVKNKNNHFNLIRLIAAFVVLAAHSTTLLGVELPPEQFIHGYNVWIGTVAVNVFFVISGFLVTASLFNRQNVISFLWARFLRIFPALWVMVLVVVFGLGMALTKLSIHEYLTSPMTQHYLWRCMTVVNGMAYYLPGVFVSSPHNQMVNGSLWTICVELRLYEYLAGLWVIFYIVGRYRRQWLSMLFFVVAAALFIFVVAGHTDNTGASNSYLFFAGAVIYVFGNKIRVSSRLIKVLMVFISLSLVYNKLFFIVYLLSLPLLVLSLAYTSSRALLRFNSLGDYSYGAYIYAFPIQQSLVTLNPNISLIEMVVYSFALTLGVAILSWHFVEKPALSRKEVFAEATMRLIRSISASLRR